MDDINKTIDAGYNKRIADDIKRLLTEIRNSPFLSARRWVWELLQNAKDIDNKYGKVSVEIELVSNNELKFRHNGNPFTDNNLTGLILQVSSKNSLNLDGQTGKFGTGFICTHLLSDVIDVSGIVQYKGVYRKFTLELDRSGESSEELLPRIAESLKKLRNIESVYPIVNDYNEHRTEQSYDTVFTYHLSSREKYESAIAGLNDLINTLPITLIIQANKIKQVRVINRVENTDIIYTCKSICLDENVNCWEIQIGDIQRRFLSFETKDVILITEIEKNGLYKLVKRKNNQPVLYRDFPLVGSEKFYFPYTLNGCNFNPTEKRNGLFLNSYDDSNARNNRFIIEASVKAALCFNEWLISHNAENRYLMATSRIPEATEKYDDSVALPWIKNLQYSWRKQLLEQYVVETENSIEQLKSLSLPAFGQSKEDKELFFNLVSELYLGKGVLPKASHLHGWFEVINPEYEAWGIPLKYELKDFLTDLQNQKDISTLCTKTNQDKPVIIAWLNKVYKFLTDKNLITELENYTIIPNQKGEFKYLSDLKTDSTSLIPTILKEIYNCVVPENMAIEHSLIDNSIDDSVFGHVIRSFGLKEMIDVLNKFIKDGGTISKTGDIIDIKQAVAYRIISLYPNSTDTKILMYRKDMYDFSCSYMNLDTYRQIDTDNLDLWKEADNYWFQNSFKNIENKGTIEAVASSFFLNEKTVSECLCWINGYLKFYRDNAKGDIIKEHSVFPNQKLLLKKLSELRYDNEIDEEFKTLAEYITSSNYTEDIYRPILIHRTIQGYEQQNPLSTKDVYENILKTFTEKISIQERVASEIIALLPMDKDEKTQYEKLYRFAVTLFPSTMPKLHNVSKSDGFKWGFAHEYYIKQIAKKIAESINLLDFKRLSNEFISMNDTELIGWVDSFIEFVYGFKSKRYWKFITDREQGYGIWLNQHNAFCKFQDVRKDEIYNDDVISTELKNLVLNRHINKDYKEFLFNSDSRSSLYLETAPVGLKDIGEAIDSAIELYDRNNYDKQDRDFASLIFAIGKLCRLAPSLSEHLKIYNAEKNKFIVGSLPQGETMDLVGDLIQQGNEKLKMAKVILEQHSVDDLQKAVETLQNKQQYEHEINGLQEQLTELKKETEIYSIVKEISEKFSKSNIISFLQILQREQGENMDSIQQNITDIRKREIGDKGECYVYEYLCERFEQSQIIWSNQASSNDYDRSVFFKEKNYLLKTTSHDFDFKVITENEVCYIEVKTTTGNIRNSKDFPLIFATKEWEWIDNNQGGNASHIIIRVFDIEGTPKAYFLKQALSI